MIWKINTNKMIFSYLSDNDAQKLLKFNKLHYWFIRLSKNTVQLEGFFSFPPIPVGNKTEWKDLKFLSLCESTHFSGNTAMKTQVFFSAALSGFAEGWLESYVLYLAWPNWKGLKFYSPCGSTHLGGNSGGLQGDHRVNVIKLQVMFEWSLV